MRRPDIFVFFAAVPGEIEAAFPAGHVNVMVVGPADRVSEKRRGAVGMEDFDVGDAGDGRKAAIGEIARNRQLGESSALANFL